MLRKTQGIFQKTQVFANSELEIVAEKRQKKSQRACGVGAWRQETV